MAIANSEWWNRAAIPAEVQISVRDRLKQAAELLAANVGQTIGRLANPPYPTADGRPLKITHYPNGQKPEFMSATQLHLLLEQLRGVKSTK